MPEDGFQFFFSKKNLSKWRTELKRSLIREITALINRLPDREQKIIQSNLDFLQEKGIISQLEQFAILLTEYFYFRDLNLYLQSSIKNIPKESKKLELLSIHSEILETLKMDFGGEDFRFLDWERLNPGSIQWKEFFDKLAKNSFTQAKQTKKSIESSDSNLRDLISWKLYKHRTKAPEETGSLDSNSQVFAIKKTPTNLYNQIVLANKNLSSIWPQGYEIFNILTEQIQIVRSKGLVSYSHFHEQGISYINLWERDYVDTVDDLFHENAHHHLNLILKKMKIFQRVSEDEIYYSPWRKSLRSIRAILHACFTFTWGAMLFEQITNLPHPESVNLNAKDINRSALRFVEEVINNKFSLCDLQEYAAEGGFTEKGILLVRTLEEINKRQIILGKEILDGLPKKLKLGFLKLEQELESKRVEFRRIFNP